MIPKIAIHSAKTRLNAALLLVALLVTPCFSFAQAKLVQTPYREPRVVFDLYFDKYRDAVERMRYYAGLGVEFKVCGLAAHDYGYRPEDFQDFVQIVPSAITELAHWQMQGYALITPVVLEKKFSIEAIR